MTLSKMSLVDKFVHLLSDREDVEIIHASDDGIIFTQLRRVWGKTTLNPAGFNPVERESWAYYGQTVMVTEPVWIKRKGQMEIKKEQRDAAAKLGRIGVHFIFAESMDELIYAIGPVPSNIGEFIGRKEK